MREVDFMDLKGKTWALISFEKWKYNFTQIAEALFGKFRIARAECGATSRTGKSELGAFRS
jgi:hypothetical protein